MSYPRLCIAGILLVALASGAAPASADQASARPPRALSGTLDAGSEHTCAILAGGAVRCWGDNTDGELGLGRPGSVGDRLPPSSAGPDDLGGSALSISAGGAQTCAILAAGALRCWGYGLRGALGYGDTDTVGLHETPASKGPVDLGPGRTATAVAEGLDFTCAILDTGSVRCWGGDDFGQLGIADRTGGDKSSPTGPVDLGPGRRAVAITAGWYSVCAILDDGTVRCWGINRSGQLGTGTQDDVGDDETPGSVPALRFGSPAVAITAGEFHTCVLLADGTVHCWGGNDSGQLGNGTQGGMRLTPGPALSLPRPATAIASGADHTCALLDDGTMHCWGLDDNGELGYGSAGAPLLSPGAAVNVGGTVTAIALGDVHTCALLAGGSVKCWGFGADGQLGYGNLADLHQPDGAIDVGGPVGVPPGGGGGAGGGGSGGGGGAGGGGSGGGGGAGTPPPVAQIGILPAADGGHRMRFGGGGGGSLYTWTFGDGSRATCGASAPVASHVYRAPGTYTVGLTVSGAGGTASTSQRVAVSGALPHADPTNSTCGRETSATAACTSEVRWELIDAVALDGGCFTDVTPRPDRRSRCPICATPGSSGGAASVPPWFAEAARTAGARMFSYAGRVEINGLIYTPHVSGGLGGTVDIAELVDAIYSADADVALPFEGATVPLSAGRRVAAQLPRTAPALSLPPNGRPPYVVSPCDTPAVQALPQIAQLSGASGRLGGFTVGGPLTLKALDGTTIVCAPIEPPGVSACPGAAQSGADGTLVTTNAAGLDPSRVYATLWCGTLDQIGLYLNLSFAAGHFQGTGTADGALPGVTLPAFASFTPGGGLATLDAGGSARVGPLDVTDAAVTVTPEGTTGTLALQTPSIVKLAAPALRVSGSLALPNRSATPSFVVQGPGFIGPYGSPVSVKVLPRAAPVGITGVANFDAVLVHELWGGTEPDSGRPYSYFYDLEGRDGALPFDVWDASHFNAGAAATMRQASDYFGTTGFLPATIAISDAGVGGCFAPSSGLGGTGLVITWPMPQFSPTTNNREPNVHPCSELGLVSPAAAGAAAAGAVQVPRGVAKAVFAIDSPSSHPAVTLLGPRGERVPASGGGPGGFDAVVTRPSAGVWRVEPAPGVAVTAVRLLVPAPLRVAARAGRELSYRASVPAGARVEFVDRWGGGSRLLGTVGSGRGRLPFAPAAPGLHTVVALVQEGAMTLRARTVARIRVPRRPAPAGPARVTLRRRGRSTLVLAWSPVPGASRYIAAVTLTDGRRLYRTGRARALTVRGVPKRVGATARVSAAGGRVAVARLAARR